MKRLECLDGLRGVLAVYVMISHMAPFAMLPEWVLHPFSHGGAAVDVFFILSGLVIVGSLRNYQYRAAPFLVARFARIYPVFVVVLGLSIAGHAVPLALDAMTWLPPDGLAYRMWARGWPTHWPLDLAAHLTMTHGLFPDGTYPHVWISLLGASWSLSTEWQFYVLALILGGAFTRIGWHERWLAWSMLAIAVVGTIWASCAPEDWRFSRAFLGNKAGYFALGVLSARLVLARLQPNHERLRLETAGRRSAPESVPDGISRAVLAEYGMMLVAVMAICSWQGGAGKLAAPLVWILCLAAQIAPVGPLRPLSAILRTRVLQWLGVLSYGIYLVNEPVQRALGTGLVHLTGADGAIFTVLWIPLAILVPIWAAAWLHRHVEAPGQQWGRGLIRLRGQSEGRFVFSWRLRNTS